MRTFRYISILIALLAISCTGSKKTAKKALELDQAGMYAEAANMYLDAVRRNRNNVDAKIGLKQTGQKFLNDKLSTFFKASNTGEKENAVNAFLEAERYVGQVRALGVVLEIPDHYQQDFARVKDDYLHDLYEDGQELMSQERYQEAENIFSKIGKLDPEFKDAQNLQDIAFLEPVYQEAKTAFTQQHYRAAYDGFSDVLAKDGGYKDAYALRASCVELGRYTIAVPRFSNGGNSKEVTRAVSMFAQNEMANMNDPFIKVVDRDNMDRILKEQELALSGVVDNASAVEVGNLLGAQAVLLGEVVKYTETRSPIQKVRKIGYLQQKVKVRDPETNETKVVTKYKRTNYYEHQGTSKVVLTVNYKLISMETGEIIFSKVVDEHVNHRVDYASFEGNNNLLFPAYSNGKVNNTVRAQKALRSTLSANRSLPSFEKMRDEAVREVCGGMAYKVQSELARKMQ